MTSNAMKNKGMPGASSTAIVPSDAANLATTSRWLWVGTGGNVALLLDEDANDAGSRVLKNVASGTLLPFAVKKVFSTGTNALDLVAIY